MKVVIVGGGIIGTALAARLGETDHDVTLLERRTLGTETTATSAGMVLQSMTDPDTFDLRLRERARSTYEDALESGELEATELGTLYVADTEAYATKLESAADDLRERGVEASYLSGGKLSSLGVDPEGAVGGLHAPGDLAFEPADIVAYFATDASAHGVELLTETELGGVRRDSEGAVSGVETSRGRLEADLVVNAAGPWAYRVNELVDVSLPLCHTMGPMVELEGSQPVEAPFVILESRRYVRPVGTSRAYVGEFITEYTEGQRYGPSEFFVSSEFRQAATGIGDVVPALEDATVVDEWVGLRTVTPDGRPIAGETSVPGFFVACGMTGLGITLAPAIADVLAATISGTVDDEVARRIGPARF